MPDNVQIVGIVCDYNEGWEGEANIRQAKQICEEAGVDFVQIVPDKALDVYKRQPVLWLLGG